MNGLPQVLALAILLAPLGSAAADQGQSAAAGVIRADDQRVAEVAYRIATRASRRCMLLSPTLGFTIQHLAQFTPADRAAAIRAYRLDRGPGVLAVVASGPAATAGVAPGDVLLAINGVSIPPQADSGPFDQAAARARTDQLLDLLDTAALSGLVTLLVSGPEGQREGTLTPQSACRSRVHLARSDQLNAFADGVHVFLTTRLLAVTISDDALAFVIAHEMAHNVLGHATVMRATAGSLEGLLRKPALSRQQEREADRLAVELMLEAGYATEGAIDLLRAVNRGPGIPFFARHDDVGRRSAAIRAHAAAYRSR